MPNKIRFKIINLIYHSSNRNCLKNQYLLRIKFIFIYLIIIFVIQLAGADFLEKTALMNVSKHVMIVTMPMVSVIMDASQDGWDISAKNVTLF